MAGYIRPQYVCNYQSIPPYFMALGVGVYTLLSGLYVMCDLVFHGSKLIFKMVLLDLSLSTFEVLLILDIHLMAITQLHHTLMEPFRYKIL